MIPPWLHLLSIISLIAGGICAAAIAMDEFRHPQHMGIMNVVWPITALYAGPLALWLYFAYGRAVKAMPMPDGEPHIHGGNSTRPPAVTYAIATTHCGSGCALGDVLSEIIIYFFPIVLTWLGYPRLWNQPIFSAWILDFVLAFLFGIAFQYLTIVPMKHLSAGRGLIAALKADSLSLTAWQIGMYGWMAAATFLLFKQNIASNSAVFWFMMQRAMLAGFVTSFPVNIWLVRRGIKEPM
jgi:hypothetical protein